MVGSRTYNSLELVEGSGYDSVANDYLACGVILFTMRFGIIPFRDPKATDPCYRHFIYNNPNGFWNKHEEFCEN